MNLKLLVLLVLVAVTPLAIARPLEVKPIDIFEDNETDDNETDEPVVIEQEEETTRNQDNTCKLDKRDCKFSLYENQKKRLRIDGNTYYFRWKEIKGTPEIQITQKSFFPLSKTILRVTLEEEGTIFFDGVEFDYQSKYTGRRARFTLSEVNNE